jgi:hypothetical protein
MTGDDLAFDLCFTLLTTPKNEGRFRLPLATVVYRFGEEKAARAVRMAAFLGWVVRTETHVQLTAAGIHVAKSRPGQ